jgi:hypothetical protein
VFGQPLKYREPTSLDRGAYRVRSGGVDDDEQDLL